jgi:hypothetical protein
MFSKLLSSFSRSGRLTVLITQVEKQVSTVLQDAILRHEQHLEKLRSMQQMFAASEVSDLGYPL